MWRREISTGLAGDRLVAFSCSQGKQYAPVSSATPDPGAPSEFLDDPGECGMRANQASDTSTVTAIGTDWRAVADELGTALRQALLRNPSLPAWAWEQGQAALTRYDHASGNVVARP
jgi:hypothetical protein